jgi:glycosyltransferase involved in cell wall biosynthesis
MLHKPRLDADAAELRRALLLGVDPGPKPVVDARNGLGPRPVYDELARRVPMEVISYAPAEDRSALLRWLFKRDMHAPASLKAFGRRGEYDVLYLNGEDIGFRVLPLLKLAGWRGEVVMLVHTCITPKWKRALKAIGPDIFRTLICFCQAQRDILVDDVGFPPEKVACVHHWMDTRYFAPPADRPGAADRHYVFSAGLENRDYVTLKRAAALTPYAFQVAAAGFWGDKDASGEPTPSNVEMLPRLTYGEVKPRYAGARFVVVPLNPVPYAAGVNGALEGMAMGQAVIVSDSPGIRDYVEDGVTGLVVPPHDPEALARAVRTLWDQPERCDEMGRRNRARMESNAALEKYVEKIGAIVRGEAPAHS